MSGPNRPPPPGRRSGGEAIVKASLAGTALFAATAGLAAAVSEVDVVALVVALGLFMGGTVAFIAGLVRAAGRSRREELTLAGLFFLEGAPRAVRRLVLGSLAVEVVVAFTTAGVRPNSSLAFGILAPVWGQGLAALWGARHNSYPPRRLAPRPVTPADSRPPAPRSAAHPAAADDDGLS